MLSAPPQAVVGASLQQVVAAARLPNSGIAGIAVNASLAFIEGAKPKGEVECALGSAEATASIEMLPRKRPRQPDCSRLRNSGGGSSGVRSGGAQFVRVEHVHVNEGGQAVIGPVAVDRTQVGSEKAAGNTG
jgi:hypothetical protein